MGSSLVAAQTMALVHMPTSLYEPPACRREYTVQRAVREQKSRYSMKDHVPPLGTITYFDTPSGNTLRAYRSRPPSAVEEIATAILFPPGMWLPSAWNEVVAELNVRGITTYVIELPGDWPGYSKKSVKACVKAGAYSTLDGLLAEICFPVVHALRSSQGANASLLPIFLGGWAFGNRLARAAAWLRPNLFAGVIIASANHTTPPQKLQRQMFSCILDLKFGIGSSKYRARKFASVFMHVDPKAEVDAAQMPAGALVDFSASFVLPAGKAVTAAFAAAGDEWIYAGGLPMLVLQGAHDRLSPRDESGLTYKQERPDQVTLVELEAGHWCIAEQPQQCGCAIAKFVKTHATTSSPPLRTASSVSYDVSMAG